MQQFTTPAAIRMVLWALVVLILRVWVLRVAEHHHLDQLLHKATSFAHFYVGSAGSTM